MNRAAYLRIRECWGESPDTPWVAVARKIAIAIRDKNYEPTRDETVLVAQGLLQSEKDFAALGPLIQED